MLSAKALSPETASGKRPHSALQSWLSGRITRRALKNPEVETVPRPEEARSREAGPSGGVGLFGSSS